MSIIQTIKNILIYGAEMRIAELERQIAALEDYVLEREME